MKKYLTGLAAMVVAVGAGTALLHTTSALAQTHSVSAAVFDADGKLKLPVGYREWVFGGAPLTPNGLNGGEASFPEFHHVYVEARNLHAYQRTGAFPKARLS